MADYFSEEEAIKLVTSNNYNKYSQRDQIEALHTMFKLKSRIVSEIWNTPFDGREGEDACKHVKRVLQIAKMTSLSNCAKEVFIWRCFPATLGGRARRWLKELSPDSVDMWKKLEDEFLRQYNPTPKFAKKKVEIKSFKQEREEPIYQAWKPTWKPTLKPTTEDRPNYMWINDALKRMGERHEEHVEVINKSRRELSEALEEFVQFAKEVQNRKVPSFIGNIWDNDAPTSVVTTRSNKEIEAHPIQELKEPVKEKKPEREIAKEEKVTFITDQTTLNKRVFYIDEFYEILEEEWRNSQAKLDEEKMALGEVACDQEGDIKEIERLLGYINQEEEEEEENNFLDTGDATRRAPKPRDTQTSAEEFQSIQLPENLKYPKDECNNLMLQKVKEEGTKEEETGDLDSDKATRRANLARAAQTSETDFQFLQFSENLESTFLAGESNALVIVSTGLEGFSI